MLLIEVYFAVNVENTSFDNINFWYSLTYSILFEYIIYTWLPYYTLIKNYFRYIYLFNFFNAYPPFLHFNLDFWILIHSRAAFDFIRVLIFCIIALFLLIYNLKPRQHLCIHNLSYYSCRLSLILMEDNVWRGVNLRLINL